MYDIIDQLMEDHQKILTFLNGFEIDLLKFMETGNLEKEKFIEAICFIRTFADKQHHQREENGLFQRMIDDLGDIAENLVKQGMMIEHDFARKYVKTLESAINEYEVHKTPLIKMEILANGYSYIQLLRSHIEKEDKVVYTFARRKLDSQVLVDLLNQ